MDVSNFYGRLRSNRRLLLNLGYWVIVTIVFLFERSYLIRKAGLPYFMACTVVRVALLVGISYLNSYVLMPAYLARKKYLTYFALVNLLIITYIAIQSLYDYFLFGFVIGSKSDNLYVALLINSLNTVWYLVLSVLLKLSIDWYEQNRALQQTRIEKLQAEINYLRAQVNPHFLFNVLNSLYSLTMKKSDLAPSVVLKLSDMMEYMLYESDETFVSLEKEISYLKNYLELEKMRQGNEAQIDLDIRGEAAGKQIAPFMLLPLAENAFKHGVSKTLKDAWLGITINIEKTTLYFTIENNRLHFHDAGKKNGIGLSNLKKRLDLLYPGRHTLEVTEANERFKVHLSIEMA
ncbi:histidine kinase [Flavihumibacter sp. R14]|nr:histidine kinase [Flavihumibacter soli]